LLRNSYGIPDIHLEDFAKIDDIYMGVNRAIGKSTSLNRMIAFDSKYAELFQKLASDYEIADLEYSSNFSHLVCITAGVLRCVVSILRDTDIAIATEYGLLSRQIYDLKRFAPIETSYSYSHLTDDDFEMLCFDLLNRMGLKSVNRIGKTNAPDGGVDIIAYEEIPSIFGMESRKAICQCKHTKNSVGRKDVAEIKDLLEEHNAQAYILFCSNSITPSAVARLEHKKGHGAVNIKFFSRDELSVLIEANRDLELKYRLLDTKLKV